MPVDTKQSDRRTLQLNTFDDLVAELDSLEAAHRAGTLQTTGNWTPGQIFSHLAVWIQGYLDGLNLKIALPLKLVGPFMKKRFMTKGFAPGLPVPGGMEGEDASFDEGLDRLRTQLLRLDAGESMAHKNPFFGTVTHDEATLIHLRHAEHHLGFLRTSPEQEPEDRS